MYSPFDFRKNGEKIHFDIFRIISRRDIGNDVIAKIRTSNGYRVTEYFGAF